MGPNWVDLWGGWSLALPNPCETAHNPDGSWSAWDATHVVDLSIIEVTGSADGRPLLANEMLGEGKDRDWPLYEIDGAMARISTDVEITGTSRGPQPIEWTRVHAAATNTELIMSIGNEGVRDAAWHEELWRSIAHD